MIKNNRNQSPGWFAEPLGIENYLALFGEHFVELKIILLLNATLLTPFVGMGVHCTMCIHP